MWGMRRKGTLLRKALPVGAYVDLWVGGPSADGRGLDAVNGGHAPAPGLTIVSPSSSTPSSSARFLIRAADGTWRDKQAGVLAGIGGRVWTGAGWTYKGASNVTFLGPLPPLSTNGVVDTVRRYSGGAGYTVQDAPGGVVQPYSQRVDVDSSQSGGDLIASPPEMLASVDPGNQIYWHGIVETTTPELFQLKFGVYSGGFFDGDFTMPQPLSHEQTGSSGTFTFEVRHRGTGPNGGLVVEYFVTQRITQSKSNVESYAYLLRAFGTSQARTIYIHQAAMHRLPHHIAKIYEMPTFMLVANGAQASLVKENFAFGGEQTNVTLVARMDLRKYDLTAGGYRVFAYAVNAWHTPLQISGGYYGVNPPSGSYGELVADLVTLAVAIGADRVCYGYRDGVYQNTLPLNAPENTEPGYMIGTPSASDARTLLVPYRRMLVFPRPLSGTKILAVHQSIVAAEGGA